MSTTMTPTDATEAAAPPRQRRRWVWIAAAVALAAVFGVALALLVGSDGPTYAYELNGSLEEEGGGPALTALGGTLGAEGYVFEFNQGLALNADLGESYDIEMRVRVDETRPNPWVKVLDFRDRVSDAGLYIHDWTALQFYFTEACPGNTDLNQGCREGEDRRMPLFGQPDTLELGSFATIRLVRHGETGMVEAYVNGDLQTWSPLQDLEPLAGMERLEGFEDFTGEATFGPNPVLHFMTDDERTTREAGAGEIDYIHITTP